MATGEGLAAIIASLDNLTDGWFPIHKAKKQAKADAAYPKTYIERLRENGIELSEGEAKAFQLMHARSIQSGENLAAILESVQIPDGAPVDQIQNEWYAAWVDGAKDAFSEWNRSVYRKVIERKAVDPQSFSRVALGVIAKMDEEDIGAIGLLNGLCPEEGAHPRNPMVLSDNDEILDIVGLSNSMIGHLCDIGLLRQIPERIRNGVVCSKGYLQYPGDEGYVVVERQNGLDLMVLFDFPGMGKIEVPTVYTRIKRVTGNEHNHFLDYGDYVFTEAGKEISVLIDPVPCARIEEYMKAGYSSIAKEEEMKNSADVLADREFERRVKKIMDRNLR